MNKTIYMTYKKNVPSLVFDRWKNLNPEYNIDFSLDNDCIHFLKENFNDYICELFKNIKVGMYKADLWRLCKLYVHGGVYADVDLIPYLNINELDKDVTFFSCLSINHRSIFQAFMVNFNQPRNPLILHFLLSFLINKPYTYFNGPTYDMYNCIFHNLNKTIILPEKKYEINEIKININIGTSIKNIKKINLYYFPSDIIYVIKLIENPYRDHFNFNISDNFLIVTRLDVNEDIGWGYNHSCDICIQSKEVIYLFPENIDPNNHWSTAYVTLNNKKILDSRDLNYYNNNGW
jgi:hypothetical protein